MQKWVVFLHVYSTRRIHHGKGYILVSAFLLRVHTYKLFRACSLRSTATSWVRVGIDIVPEIFIFVNFHWRIFISLIVYLIQTSADIQWIKTFIKCPHSNNYLRSQTDKFPERKKKQQKYFTWISKIGSAHNKYLTHVDILFKVLALGS